MSSQSIKERKTKKLIAIKEFNDELLNVVKIEYEMEKNYSINEQQLVKIDKLYDEIWKFDEPIKNLEILLEKSSVERSSTEEKRQLIGATKEKIKGLQAKLECKQNLVIQEESETFEIFSDLYDKRLIAYVNHVLLGFYFREHLICYASLYYYYVLLSYKKLNKKLFFVFL